MTLRATVRSTSGSTKSAAATESVVIVGLVDGCVWGMEVAEAWMS
jgi:hypothetical protein